uniref:SKI/SNO/DAC domain-containing protein n=1 Tax=Neolamprologus brichardi TaxID=32507 RepID=A0A3Q4IBW6_NEOBR
MAGSSIRTSSPHTDPLLHSDPPHSASVPAGPSRLPGGSVAHADCRMVDVHGVQVASFTVDGAELVCLPQVFQLFLKHLVGGLHTVYTKLKRLRISPVVCTVEQVRVLRGLGAIQPGVNRCKLISRPDFETLYQDCTSPPSGHTLPSLFVLLSAGLTAAAAMAEILRLQKMRMMMRFHGSSDQQRHHSRPESENEDTAGGSEGSWEKEQQLLSPPPSVVAPPAGSASLHFNTLQQQSSLLANRLSDLPFMVMPHPILPVGLPPANVAMAMNHMSQLSDLANMAVVSQVHTEESKVKASSSKSSPSPTPSDDELHPQEPTSQSPSRASSSSSSSPLPPAHTPEHVNVENLKYCEGTSEMQRRKGPENIRDLPVCVSQGLLKVAVESARSQDKRSQQERKELKLELERERDARQTLQRQLSSELHTRGETGVTGQRSREL